jgi:hypothetical protein
MVKKRFFAILTLTVIAVLPPSLAAGAKEKILYRFTGKKDGGSPSSSLTMDASGNLYGTTGLGGDLSQCSNNGCGTVFELKPSAKGQWQETVLYAFKGSSDGSYPGGNLVFDGSGNIYGTTSFGGTGTACNQGCGTVFELSPNKDGTWTESILFSFQGEPDGASPEGLTSDASGNLFGITPGSGNHNNGIAYELSPPRRKHSSWTEKVLYEFSNQDGTLNPVLVSDNRGNLYGTYYVIDVQFCSFGCGAVFELKHANGQWQETDLYDFLGGGNGGQPAAGVIRDSKGNLYGTAAEGGNNFGIVFELGPSGGKWKETMIYNFCSRNNCVDGAFPLAALVMDSNGVLYGTTAWGGGSVCGSTLCGVVFSLAHTDGGWKETVLHAFRGGKSDGVEPVESLILDQKGNLYGTAGSSYGDGAGVVFEVTP